MAAPLIITIDIPYEKALDRVVEILYRHDKSDGYIGFKELPSVIVFFDMHEGRIRLKPTEETPYITVILEEKAFSFITSVMYAAISYIAKLNLLESLLQLENEALSFHIYKNLGHPAKHFTPTKVDQALYVIMRASEPRFVLQFFKSDKQENDAVLKIVAEELKKVGIHNIKSRSVTENIMRAVKSQINDPTKTIIQTTPSQMK